MLRKSSFKIINKLEYYVNLLLGPGFKCTKNHTHALKKSQKIFLRNAYYLKNDLKNGIYTIFFMHFGILIWNL